MDEQPQEKIKRLRNEFVIAEQTYNLKELLIEKRDELEKNILKLSDEVSEENLTLHQNETGNPEALKQAFDSLETKKLLLNRIKETLQQLDEKLDDYELFSMEMVLFLRHELIKAILEAHPDQKAHYEKLTSSLDQQLDHIALSNTLTDSLEQIEKKLEIIVHQRELVRRRGILRYIFGPNPNALITASLKDAYRLASNLIPKIEGELKRYPEADDMKIALHECQTIVTELTSKATSKWGWNKIDQEIIPLYYRVHEQNEKMKKAGDLLKQKIQEAQNRVNQWIDGHSRGGTRGLKGP